MNLCVSLAPSKPVSTLMERIESDYALKQSRESTDPSRPVNISCHQILVDGAFEIVDIQDPIGDYLSDMMQVQVIASKSIPEKATAP